jgi:hypothetical protein
MSSTFHHDDHGVRIIASAKLAEVRESGLRAFRFEMIECALKGRKIGHLQLVIM